MANVFTTVGSVLPFVMAVVAAYEEFSAEGATAGEKRSAVVKAASAALSGFESGTGKDALDNAKFDSAVGKVYDAVESVLEVAKSRPVSAAPRSDFGSSSHRS